jgi:hypothetical protein
MELEDENLTPRKRLALLAAVASGASLRSIARQFHVTLATVQHWVARSARAPVTTIADCLDHPRGPKACPNRTKAKMEQRVVAARHKLGGSPLGEIGAEAIHASLKKTAPKTTLPSIRTIGRILERSGILDGKTRCRRSAPRPGWYLPALAAREAELDSFDGVEGLVIAGGQRVEVFNAISLFGGLPGSWPHPVLRTDLVLENLSEHWRRHGLPHYAQFDNDTLFQGAHQYADTVGRVVRLCLQLEVTPVFAPPREPGFQAAIENYNGRWQAKVWNRFQHADLAQLRRRSTAYVNALAARCTPRIERAPARRPWPASFTFQPLAAPQNRLIYLRRTNPLGQAHVLGHKLLVDPNWPGRLVRAEVCFTRGSIEFYALRRRDPTHQPLLRALAYRFPDKTQKRGRATADTAHTFLSKK